MDNDFGTGCGTGATIRHGSGLRWKKLKISCRGVPPEKLWNKQPHLEHFGAFCSIIKMVLGDQKNGNQLKNWKLSCLYNDYHKGVLSVSIFESDWLDAHRVLYIWFIYGHEVKRKLPPLNTELWLVDTHDVPVATLFEWVSLSSRARADSRSAGQFGNFPPSHPGILRVRGVNH